MGDEATSLRRKIQLLSGLLSIGFLGTLAFVTFVDEVPPTFSSGLSPPSQLHSLLPPPRPPPPSSIDAARGIVSKGGGKRRGRKGGGSSKTSPSDADWTGMKTALGTRTKLAEKPVDTAQSDLGSAVEPVKAARARRGPAQKMAIRRSKQADKKQEVSTSR
jgi:hypothetical protein